MADTFWTDARGNVYRKPAAPYVPSTPVSADVKAFSLTGAERAEIMARVTSDPVRQALVAADAIGGGLGGVSISGTPALGAVLQASLGSGLEATGWQWLRDGVAIAGATQGTYMLTSNDLGKSITARATGISYLGTAVLVPTNAPAPTPPAPPPSNPNLTQRVVGMGNSTMVAVDTAGNQITASQRPLNIFATARGIPALNKGFSGTVLQSAASHTGSPLPDNMFGRYVTDTLGANLSAVVICDPALNDLRYTGAPATMNLTNFIAQLTIMVDAWLAQGCEVILASPAWIPDDGYATAQSVQFTGSSRTVHEQYVAAIWQLAKSKGVKYANNYERMKAIGATMTSSDKIHPSVAGYAVMGQGYIEATVPTEATWPGTAAPPPPPPADVTAPTLVSAVVPNSARNTIVFTYSEALDANSVPAAAAYTPSGGRSPVGVGISGAAVTVIVNNAYAPGDAITSGYTPGASPVRDAAGNAAAALTAQVVTNNASDTSDADVDAWLVRVASASGTVSSGEQTAVRNFVASAKGSGYYTKFRRLNLFVGDDAASLVPLVSTSGSGVDTNSGTTYAAATGRQSNGSSQYLNTGYTPTQATGGMSIYLRTAQPSDTTQRIPIGCRNSANTHAFRMTANSANNGVAAAGGVVGIWGGTAPGPFAAATGGMTAGLWHSSRTSNTSLSLYKNGALANNVTTDVTPADPTQPVYVFAQNGGGTPGAYVAANTQIGAYGVDSGMTDAEAANYYTHMQTLMTALGRNV